MMHTFKNILEGIGIAFVFMILVVGIMSVGFSIFATWIECGLVHGNDRYMDTVPKQRGDGPCDSIGQ